MVLWEKFTDFNVLSSEQTNSYKKDGILARLKVCVSMLFVMMWTLSAQKLSAFSSTNWADPLMPADVS